MWKSRFSLRGTTGFFTQGECAKQELFHRACGKNFKGQFFTVQLILYPQATVNNFPSQITAGC